MLSESRSWRSGYRASRFCASSKRELDKESEEKLVRTVKLEDECVDVKVG